MISIIIPNYNRETLIEYTLNSIIEQSYTDWECIIVDDGSTDNSEQVVQEYIDKDHRFSFYKRPASAPKGANSCRNLGLQKAKGEYVKWLDSDDLLLPNCLTLQIDLLKENAGAKVCFGYGRFFNDATGKLEGTWSRKTTSADFLYDHIINQIRWPIGGLLWRKNSLLVEPFLPALKNSQEWLMHSLALARYKREEYINLPEIVYLIRRGNLRMSSSVSSTYYFNQARSRYLLLKALFKEHAFSVKMHYQLCKQILIFLFYALKKLL